MNEGYRWSLLVVVPQWSLDGALSPLHSSSASWTSQAAAAAVHFKRKVAGH